MVDQDQTMNFEFTESQRRADLIINDFIKTPISNKFNDRVLVLTGAAGTGKTTLLKHTMCDLISEDLLNDIYDEDRPFSDFGAYIPNVMGVTISHKAKLRLRESIPNSSTYVNYFGMKPVYEYDGSVKFQKIERDGSNPNMKNKIMPHELPFRIVTHDEVGMYGMSQLQFLQKYTNLNSKVILVGDRYQLPPILEKGAVDMGMDSPIFTYYHNQVDLKEPVRQTKGNPILELCYEIKDEIDGKKDLNRILRLLSVDKFSGGIGYRNIKARDLVSDFIEQYKIHQETRIIAYYNKSIRTHNQNVRAKMFKNVKDRFTVGDAIYLNDSYIDPDSNSFYNSEEFIIKNLGRSKVSQESILCYNAIVEGRMGALNMVHESNDEMVKAILKAKQNEIDKASFAQKYKAIDDLSKFRQAFANVSYGYAFTAYKAQGSGFRNVYIDLIDLINSPLTNKRKLQSLYTSITRATHQVIFF